MRARYARIWVNGVKSRGTKARMVLRGNSMMMSAAVNSSLRGRCAREAPRAPRAENFPR
jgi:hypothetical protein